jgi:hypothetical protein
MLIGLASYRRRGDRSPRFVPIEENRRCGSPVRRVT